MVAMREGRQYTGKVGTWDKVCGLKLAKRKWQNASPTFGSCDKYLVKNEYGSVSYCIKLQNIPCEGLRERKAEAGRNEAKKQRSWERKKEAVVTGELTLGSDQRLQEHEMWCN